MKTEEAKCICNRELGRDESKKVWFHLMCCPQGSYVKEYDTLPWYKKILTKNPMTFCRINRTP